MNKLQVNPLQLGCSLILFAVGLVILLNSLDLANGVMSGMMGKNGGSMNTDTYHLYLQASISNFRILGTVFIALGGLGSLLSSRRIYKSE